MVLSGSSSGKPTKPPSGIARSAYSCAQHSPAAQAGIQAGDIIVAVNDQPRG
ncbi:PDZ domain-containing protein [Leptolyngbya ohadii]|uniref:PDZ domain-containing protein n=1 Tax=Leptolyngbya ohadii TaxID=1962290 RepID=UPI001CEC91AE|nr:PDZ domain-containing protein [Leptolyngbya ohadii]